MKFTVLTLFPDMIHNACAFSIFKRGLDQGLIELDCVDIRCFTDNKHRRVDDYPYGGGLGMVMQAQPIYDAYKHVLAGRGTDTARVVYLTPAGKPLTQSLVTELSQESGLILLCGHYEGIDERVIEEIVTDEVSLGDYILTGGELAALVLMDAVARLVPGVLGKEGSAHEESFSFGLLEHPQYTRPASVLGRHVPEVLISGDHKAIENWRREQSLLRTRLRRPDLI